MAEEKEARRSLSRRDFVKGATVLAGAGALASCAPAATPAPAPTAAPCPTCPPPEECPPCLVPGVPETWDEETDVAVVGFGGAGAAAAITANDAGADVIILEKGEVAGGSTALSGQVIYAAGTSVQKAAGIDDSPENMLAFYMAACDGDPDVIRMLCYESAPSVEWLIGLGMKVPAQLGSPGLAVTGVEPQFAGVTPVVPRGHNPEKDTLLWATLFKAAQEREIKYYLETPASRLVWNGTDVVGVEAQKDGESWHIKAKKGVVIAAGGFTRNSEMLYDLVSDAEFATWTCPMDHGDGIRMAQRVGAGVAFVDGIMGTAGWQGTEVYCLFLVAPQYVPENPPFIVINLEGKRFMDETIHYYYANRKVMEQPESISFLVTAGEAGKNAIPAPDIKTSETVEGLAEELGLDLASVVSTVDAWNESCEQGADREFGRAELLSPLAAGPYYSAAVIPGFGGTLGGLKINPKAEVLNALTRQPIPRLYAAGCGAASYGRFYPASGTQLNDCVCTGRMAGTNAAAQEPWG
jgi:succinate dehydrogenase/fumarate reductase flavoprotein subunit